jgi:hypothetical protein
MKEKDEKENKKWEIERNECLFREQILSGYMSLVESQPSI